MFPGPVAEITSMDSGAARALPASGCMEAIRWPPPRYPERQLCFDVEVAVMKHLKLLRQYIILPLVLSICQVWSIPTSAQLLAPDSTGPKAPATLSADESTRVRARFSQPDSLHSIEFTPLKLSSGGKLTLIAPPQWSTLVETLAQAVQSTHTEFTRRFGAVSGLSTSLRLMEEDAFFRYTGAPSWTNALYIRGQIVIPINSRESLDLDNVTRSVKHEFSHAMISALSAGRTPGWIDEGLAQLTEGAEHPELRRSLQRWLSQKAPVPLNLLQGGFTRLPAPMVPPAYAQSLLAVKALLDTYGSKPVAQYFAALRSGAEPESAFAQSFGVSTPAFEQKLGLALKQWTVNHEKSDHHAPPSAHGPS